jgi:hypothetical protein
MTTVDVENPFPVHIFPDRPAPQGTSEDMERNIVAQGVQKGKFEQRIRLRRDRQ